MNPQNDEQSIPKTPQRKHIGLLRASTTVGGMTVLSRISGFVRDVVFAHLFGATGMTDAFFVAFKIPNFFRRLFAEGAFSQAFIPVFAEYREKHGLDALRSLVSHVGGALFACLLLLTTVMAAAAPLVILVFAPGFADDHERYALATEMLRYTSFYLLFISLVALSGSIQNSFHKFAAPAFTPVLLNLTLITCAVWLSPNMKQPIVALAIGTFIAGAVQLLFQVPFLLRLGMLPRPRFSWQHEGMRKVIRLMLPAMLGSAVVQINLLLDTIFASFLIVGSVTWLYYADRMVELPLGVFSIAIATVILPSLSGKHARGDADGFSRNLDWGLRTTTLITMPAAAGIILLAGPILLSLFQGNQFSIDDAMMTRVSLIAYTIGLPAFGYVKILAPGFFARHDTRTPVRIAVYSMIFKLLVTLLTVTPLYLYGIRWAHAGLALATALSAWAQTLLLYWYLRRGNFYRPVAGWLKFSGQIFAATAAMSALLLFVTPESTAWFEYLPWRRIALLAALIVPSILVFVSVLWLGGVRFVHFRGHH